MKIVLLPHQLYTQTFGYIVGGVIIARKPIAYDKKKSKKICINVAIVL